MYIYTVKVCQVNCWYALSCFGCCSKKKLNNSLLPISGLFIWFVLMVCLLMVTSGVTIGVTSPVTVGVTFPVTVTSGVMVTSKVTNASPFVLTDKRCDVLSLTRTQSATFCPQPCHRSCWYIYRSYLDT